MTHCSNCGAEMPQDAQFCVRCGTANPAAAGSSQPTQVPQTPPQGYQQPPQGYQSSPQGYQQPPQASQLPSQEYQPPPQGYQTPPQGYQTPPEGYQQPSQGYQQQGYQSPSQGYQQPSQPPPQMPAFLRQLKFDPSRLRPGDLIAGGGALLLLIALFLPWYSAHQSAVTRTPSVTDAAKLESLALAICGGRTACLNSNATTISISALHGGAGGWRLLILLLALVTLAYLAVRAFLPQEPKLPVQHWQIVTGVTALMALLAILALLANPLSIFNGFGATASVGFGAIIGVIVALGAVVGGVLLRPSQPHPQHRA